MLVRFRRHGLHWLQGLTSSPQRPDCVAGHVRLELRNVGANYPFEKSRRFPAIQPNLVTGDGSRLSCGVADYGQYSILDSTRYRRGSRRLMLTMGLPRLRYSPILFLTMIGIHDQFPPNRTLGLIVLGVVLWW